MTTHTKKKNFVKYIGFFIWPFVSLVMAFREYKNTSLLKNIIILFSAFIGLTFVISSDTIDANSYRDAFLAYGKTDFSNLTHRFLDYVSFADKNIPDFLLDIVFFIVSRFTDDFRYLFAAFGLIFGFFYASIIATLLGMVKRGFSFNLMMLIIGIALIINPSHGINQFRFYTASVVFTYGTLMFVYFEKQRFFLLALTSLFVHVGLILPVFSLLIFRIFGKKDFVYIPVAIISIIYSGIDFNFFGQYMSIFGAAVEYKFNAYASSSNALDRLEDMQNRVWYAVIWQQTILYALYALYVLYYIKFRAKFTKQVHRLFSYSLILISMVNFIKGFSMDFRYNNVLILILLIFLFIAENTYPLSKTNRIYKLLLPAFLLSYGIQFKALLSTMDYMIFIKNPLIAVIVTPLESITQLLGLN